MRLYRAASKNHRIFSGMGAFLKGARWNPPGYMVIYCADSLATCRLEVMAHIGRATMPLNYGYVRIDVPEDVSVISLTERDLPVGWNSIDDPLLAQDIGQRWLEEGSSCLLKVPSVAAPTDKVVLVNPAHTDFAHLSASQPIDMIWDPRHFG